jgi:hypothetical protein
MLIRQDMPTDITSRCQLQSAWCRGLTASSNRQSGQMPNNTSGGGARTRLTFPQLYPKILKHTCIYADYSKPSLIRVELWKVLFTVEYILKRHAGFRSKRTFRLC